MTVGMLLTIGGFRKLAHGHAPKKYAHKKRLGKTLRDKRKKAA